MNSNSALRDAAIFAIKNISSGIRPGSEKRDSDDPHAVLNVAEKSAKEAAEVS